MTSSPTPTLALMSLCAIDGVSWSLLAREAQKRGVDALDALLSGDISEASPDADRTRPAILAAGADIEARLERAALAIDEATSRGARLTTVLDDDYPANLRLVHDLPPFLFYRGTLERSDTRSIAVVGTRDATADGLRRARQMARGLVQAGVAVMSGLARGIDTAAHEEALANGGRTVAVLGTGILKQYPSENAELAERIAERGALVSQFWPAQGPARHTFPRRNVVTSGMSQGTVVVEASSTSGAKMQARLALAHGKRVFLIRDLVTRQPWARSYLDRGALQVDSVADVLDRVADADRIEQVAAGRRQLTLDVL